MPTSTLFRKPLNRHRVASCLIALLMAGSAFAQQPAPPADPNDPVAQANAAIAGLGAGDSATARTSLYQAIDSLKALNAPADP